MKLQEFVEIIIAYMNGAKIECRGIGTEIWCELKRPYFNNEIMEYRIKQL